jgi:hypothetical protein
VPEVGIVIGLVDDAPVAAAVDADDERLGGGLVLRPAPGARLGAAPGADPDIVLVEVGGPVSQGRGSVSGAPASSPQRAVKSGKVLPTVATLVTSMPGTARPSTAAAITMRWSS